MRLLIKYLCRSTPHSLLEGFLFPSSEAGSPFGILGVSLSPNHCVQYRQESVSLQDDILDAHK